MDTLLLILEWQKDPNPDPFLKTSEKEAYRMQRREDLDTSVLTGDLIQDLFKFRKVQNNGILQQKHL